jgi:hypothetical protein
MSNEWQHRIYNQEVPPPASIWDKINAELDESYLPDSFRGTLYNAEATPPAGTWDIIATTLAEEELSHEFPSTLYNAEATPPARTWEQITASLDIETDESPAFATALYNMEATPPPATWKNIAASLDAETSERYAFASTLYNMEATPPPATWKNIVTSFDEEPRRRRVVPLFIRYAAAAILIGAIAFGAVRLVNSFNKKDELPVADKQNTTPPTTPDHQHTGNDAAEENRGTALTNETDETRDDRALEESKGTMASLSLSDKARVAHITSQYVAADAPAATISSTEKIKPQSTYRDIECSEVSTPGFVGYSQTMDVASRYILFTTPDGRMVRISKKLGDLVCCVSGDEVDENCENQLDKWRKKIANSPVAPSPGNFMDILNLVSTLKDSNL